MSTETLPIQGDEKARRRNQMKLIGIFAVAGIPVLLAMTMYFGSFAIPTSKTNKGDLLLPTLSLSEFGFEQNTEGLFDQTEGKWLLIQTGTGECAQACQDMAHTARQVNILMAREQSRVSRVFLAPSTDVYERSLAAEYPELRAFKISEEALSALPAGEASNSSPTNWQLWISDPLGNVIMRYDASHTGYDLRDDLKKLLKLSNIG